jgi:DNA-binding transcriptional ArsR family regulator
MARTPTKAPLARITDFRQVRAIADPLRLRMLRLFAQGPLTTKQVADRLGEKPTRLYNHTRALERAGLVRLVGTRQNRGTTERYLEAVGSRFEIDERLFQLGRAGSTAEAAAYATASAILRAAAGDLDRRAARRPEGPEPLVAQAALCLTPREYERLRARVVRWVRSLERQRPAGPGRDAVFTVALIPGAPAGASGRGSRSPAGSA